MTKPPTFDSLLNPLLAAMRQLGGSGTVEEIYEKVVEIEAIPEEVLAMVHNPERGSQTEVAYRLAWARTYLRKYGLLENSSRGVWALTANGRDVECVDSQEVVKVVRAQVQKDSRRDKDASGSSQDSECVNDFEEDEEWKEKLHRVLTQDLSPDAFERLAQRVLRESGFVAVEVTGKSGDGGIDGKGIARIHGFMSFHVIFQCKRYKGSVSAGAIRDFRGAMVGRADKGLFITTGTFTPAAVKEATRDGAPPIDLVNGDELADKLKELDLGVTKEMVERVKVNDEWFKNL